MATRKHSKHARPPKKTTRARRPVEMSEADALLEATQEQSREANTIEAPSKDYGANVTMITTERSGATEYRVCVGRFVKRTFTDATEADEYACKLSRDEAAKR